MCIVFQLGDQVMYGIHGVCSIAEIEVKRVDRKNVEYFVLVPVEQPATRYYVPTGNAAALSKLRALLSREELLLLLESEAVRSNVWIPDESRRKLHYRELLNGGDRLALLQMIYTLQNQKQIQAAAGRKFHLCDENFLRDAEKVLSSEFSVVLGIPVSQVGEFIEKHLHSDWNE